MKILIDGREYDGAAQPFIGDLRLLKKEFGFGWGTVANTLAGLEEASDFVERLGDDDFTNAFVAWLWMARLRGGDRSCTRKDIEMLPLDALTIVPDEGPAEDDEVPTSAPTGSDRGASGEAKASTRSSTKTSKPRSTRG